MKYFKFSIYTVCVLLIVSAYTVFCTSRGLILLVDIADMLSEAKISAKVNRGSLYDGVEISNFKYEDAELNIFVDEIALQWQVVGLLFGRLDFSYITLINSTIIVSDNSSPEAQEELEFWLPPLSIESFTLQKLNVQSPDKTVLLELDALQLSLLYTENAYNFQDLVIKNGSSAESVGRTW